MKYDVFISYSSLDQKVAEGVCAYLEQHRIRCFIAYRDIPKGVVWAKYIVEALDESRMMVVVFSGNFNRSEQVDREIELASEDKKPILTFRIADEAFKGAKKYYLKNLNWIDAFPQPERCFGNLCENVRKLLGMEEAGEPPKPADKPAEKPKILKELEIALEGGPTDARGQYNLGYKYKTGNGVPKDFQQAVYWYRKAAEQGYAPAQNNLGYAYQHGEGVSKDLQQAVYWYRKAAEQGNVSSQYNLGYCYGEGVTKDMQQAVYWYRKAAEQGHASAQNALGYCYDQGNGVTKDKEQAAYWYRKAAEQGNASAMNNLAICYENGEGVAQDYQEAVRWYRKSIEQGNVMAQCNLGYCYEIGRGVEKNLSQAIYWYRKAAQKGNQRAQGKLTRLGEKW